MLKRFSWYSQWYSQLADIHNDIHDLADIHNGDRLHPGYFLIMSEKSLFPRNSWKIGNVNAVHRTVLR